MKPLKPVHIIHLLLYAPVHDQFNFGIVGRTRLMKMVFIFEKELKNQFPKIDKDSFKFEAYNFGPYNKKVSEALDFLFSRGYLDTETHDSTLTQTVSGNVEMNELELERDYVSLEEKTVDFNDAGSSFLIGIEKYFLTKKGVDLMKSSDCWFSWERITEDQKAALRLFKSKMVNAPLRSILEYVYDKYPNYAVNSLIKEKVMSYKKGTDTNARKNS